MIKLHAHAYLLEPTDPNPLPIPSGQAWALTENGSTTEPLVTLVNDTAYVAWNPDTRTVLYIQSPQQGIKGKPYSPIPEHTAFHNAIHQQKHTLNTTRQARRTQILNQNSTLATNATSLWKSHVFGSLPNQNALPATPANATIASIAEYRNTPKAVRMQVLTNGGGVLMDTGDTPLEATGVSASNIQVEVETSLIAPSQLQVVWRFGETEQIASWCATNGGSLVYKVAFGSLVNKQGIAMCTAWSNGVEFYVNSPPSKPVVVGFIQ